MAMPQLDESKMRLVQELEIEMMTDMYSRQFYAQKVDMSSRQFLCTVDRYVQQVVLCTVDGHLQQVVLYEQNIEMYIRLIYVQQADLLVYIQHLSIECSSASREGGGMELRVLFPMSFQALCVWWFFISYSLCHMSIHYTVNSFYDFTPRNSWDWVGNHFLIKILRKIAHFVGL